jgi:hypothetical protein
MPDTPFKSMTRETKQDFDWFQRFSKPKYEKCEECGGLVTPGDWPWCKNGDPEEHKR